METHCQMYYNKSRNITYQKDTPWCTRALITRLVKIWFEINGLWLLAAIMAIINSCLLCCCGPSAPVVLKVEANMTLMHWASFSAQQPIRVTAACLRGPAEHVSGSVQTWPLCCYSLASCWKLPIHCCGSALYRQVTSVSHYVKCDGSSGPRWPTMEIISSEISLWVTWNGVVCACTHFC